MRSTSFVKRRMARLGVVLATMVVGIASAVLIAPAASAAPSWEGDYPSLPNEGLYQNQTACAGQYVNVQQDPFTYRGRNGMLKLYYNGGCGAYVRADNMDPGCWVQALRDSNRDLSYDGAVSESSDGLTFAYTQVTNNLNGRYTWGLLWCPGEIYPVAGVGPY